MESMPTGFRCPRRGDSENSWRLGSDGTIENLLGIFGECGGPTWTPKVCKIMTFLVVFKGSGLLFYMLLGFR